MDPSGEEEENSDADPCIATAEACLERRLHTIGERICADDAGGARGSSQLRLPLADCEDRGRDGGHGCSDQANKDSWFVARGAEVG